MNTTFPHRSLAVLLAGSFMITAVCSSFAEAWPQWRGVQRDGKSSETGLLKAWPENGPTLLWKQTGLDEGYSTPSVADGKIFGMSYREEDEVCWALNETDGSLIWEVKTSNAERKIGYPHGPRSTPTFDNGELFTLGSKGQLTRLDAQTGKIHWQKHLQDDLNGRMMSHWGFSESILVDGNRILCTPGGDQGTVACLDRKTGELVWRTKDLVDRAAYASIVKTTIHDTEQYIVLTGETLAGIVPETGKLLWRIDRSGKTAVIPTPICRDNLIFVTSAYGIGCNLFEIKKTDGQFSASERYANRELENHHGGVILIGNHVYATNRNSIVCLELETGDVAWEERSVGKGSLSYADGHLYLRSEKGPIALIEANPELYVEKGRFDQPDRSRLSSWPHPVIANGRLLLRDRDKLLCFDIKPKAAVR